jgi:predicted transcriptional regulator
MVTSIQLNNKTKSKLDNLKIFPKESYDDVVKRLISMAEDDEGVLSEQTVKDLEKALDEVKRGKLVSHAEVKRKYGL